MNQVLLENQRKEVNRIIVDTHRMQVSHATAYKHTPRVYQEQEVARYYLVSQSKQGNQQAIAHHRNCVNRCT